MKLKGIKMPVKKKASINMNSDNEDDNPKQDSSSAKRKVSITSTKKNFDSQNKNAVNENNESNNDNKESQRGQKRPNDGIEPQNRKIFRQSFEELEEIKEKLKQESATLPIHKLRKKLVTQALKAKSLIIVGETGSGKTTQVPQLLYRANVCNNKCIAITQPRRVAATTLAKRVAAEMGVQLGSKVGYHVRFSNLTSNNTVTKIVFLTDGMLLRESLLDPLLKKYNVVILDEAHERTVETDVLFGIVKSAQERRANDQTLDPLKIVIMSATMDVEKFSNYFGAEVFAIPGRTHKIDLIYEKKKVKDYVSGCIERVLEINMTAPADEHVLVFLTGKDEIESAAKVLHRKAMSQDSKLPALVVLPFYSALSQDLQEKVFQPVPEGSRKVILSTNLAETSLTISGIKYVVDSGFSKVKTYDPNRGLDCLKVEPISQAQAKQRSGRAGREGPGTCYRLYNEDTFKQFPEVPVPEIQRRSLASVILQLMYMGINDVTKFDFVDKPSEKAILEAFNVLKDMKAAVVEPNIELTEDGKLMARFPLDPKYGRIILSASKYGCLHEVLIIISVLSSEEAFVDLPEERKGNREKRSPLVDDSGDLLTYLKIFREFNKKDAEFQEAWCKTNGINRRALTFAKSVKEQLKEICTDAGMAYSTLSGNLTTREMVLKSFCSGLYKNVAKFSRDRYVLLNSHREAVIHPSSILYKFKPEYLLFCELVETTGVYMRSVSKVKFDWVQLVAPEGFQKIPFSEPTNEQLKKRKLERMHARK